MPPTSYYAPGALSARFYDAVAAADPAIGGDIDCYAALAGTRRTILELGAGTGRVAIALAARGYDVTGLDLAPAMLAQAEAKRATLPPETAARLRFVRGDMTALALGRRYQAIFATYFTLAHLPPNRWKRVLAGVARHLVPGGIVGLHLPLAEMMAAAAPPADRPVFRRDIGESRTLTLFVAGKTMDAAAARMDLSLDYVVSVGDVPEQRSRERLTYFAADPAPYALAAGLARAGAPVPLGTTGLIHLFEKAGNGADEGT